MRWPDSGSGARRRRVAAFHTVVAGQTQEVAIDTSDTADGKGRLRRVLAGRGAALEWAAIALALGALLVFVACCHTVAPEPGSGHRLPSPSDLVLPVPERVTAPAESVTSASMRNVLFHLDDDIRLRIRALRGRVSDLRGEGVVVLDEKESLLLTIDDAVLALSQGDLGLLLNRYVFGYPGSPIRNLEVRTRGPEVVQTGVLHKIIDIPFEMAGRPTVTEEGWIRLHPRIMKICRLNGLALLKVVDATLEDLIDLSGATGVRVDGNDLLLDPVAILPPPKVEGTLTAVRVEGDEIVEVFGAPGDGVEDLEPPVAAENYMYFRGGTLRFGKLYQVLADLEAIDLDPADPFDFYLDYYQSQLVAGYHVTTPDQGLVTYFPDFDDLGTADEPRVRSARPGGSPPR